jgi:hypothetical protein
LLGAFGFEHLANGLLQVKMCKAGLALVQLLLQHFVSSLHKLSIQDTLQKLKAFAYVAALQFPLRG